MTCSLFRWSSTLTTSSSLILFIIAFILCSLISTFFLSTLALLTPLTTTTHFLFRISCKTFDRVPYLSFPHKLTCRCSVHIKRTQVSQVLRIIFISKFALSAMKAWTLSDTSWNISSFMNATIFIKILFRKIFRIQTFLVIIFWLFILLSRTSENPFVKWAIFISCRSWTALTS